MWLLVSQKPTFFQFFAETYILRFYSKRVGRQQWTSFDRLGCAPKGFKIIKRHDQELPLDLKLGDLILVKRASSSGGSSLGYYHAGVCCCDVVKDIIHFTPKPHKCPTQSLVGHGEVGKLDLEVFCEDDQFVVYRKENGIPELRSLQLRLSSLKEKQNEVTEF
ncbi:hypothetical protein HF521_016890 [Silurus meridionalis]|uniref:Uncharacterized protein n=1 Tax=Silurus meridionalis TaxID=175797 RepID=A0A8T0BNG1_SILME|nr:hypothetical protein HF521_016890 [Silurus meridionalis]